MIRNLSRSAVKNFTSFAFPDKRAEFVGARSTTWLRNGRYRVSHEFAGKVGQTEDVVAHWQREQLGGFRPESMTTMRF